MEKNQKNLWSWLKGPLIFLLIGLIVCVLIAGYKVWITKRANQIPIYDLTEVAATVVETQGANIPASDTQYILTLRINYEKDISHTGVRGGSYIPITEEADIGLYDLAFTLPVDKAFFDSVEVGDLLIDTYDGGSDQWVVYVWDKKVE